MEVRAEIIKERHEQVQEEKLKRRKKNLKEILRKKRMIHAHQIEEAFSKKANPQEDKEVKKEETDVKGLNSYTSTRTKFKWRSNKKCWYSGSSYYFKKYCPTIRYFHCQRLGHMKAQCFMKKMKDILQWIGKTIKTKEERKRQKKKKKEKRKKILDQYKLQAKQTKFIKQNEKWILEWEGDAIGDFISPGTPKTMEEVSKDTFLWDPVDVLTKKKIPLQKFPIIDGFGNICGCNGIVYEKKAFVEHLKDNHRGYIPPLSQINQPPWIIWVAFYDDNMESLFCQTLNLT